MYLDKAKTLEELKTQYRAWTKKLHPDCGGTDEQMKALNAEYEKFFNILENRHNATADEAHQTTETACEFIEILEALRNCRGLDIELCGSWLWISGNTYENRNTLKAAGCKWSKGKGKWYWRHEEEQRVHNHRSMSMEWIRSRYGSEAVKGMEPDPLLA